MAARASALKPSQPGSRCRSNLHPTILDVLPALAAVAARSAGLVKGLKDPRQLLFPRVGDDALTYLLYLLRGATFGGSLLNNPSIRIWRP